jgi:hypothetical protein
MAESPAPLSSSTSNRLDVFGGMNAGDRSRKMLLSDLQRAESGNLGMSGGEKRQALDTANQQAGANVAAQAKNLGQAGLASGPLSSVSGRAASIQRDAAAQLGNAGAMAAADTERTSQALAEQQRQSIKGALEREQDRARQDTQFWVGALLNPQLITGVTNVASAIGSAASTPAASPAAAAPTV